MASSCILFVRNHLPTDHYLVLQHCSHIEEQLQVLDGVVAHEKDEKRLVVSLMSDILVYYTTTAKSAISVLAKSPQVKTHVNMGLKFDIYQN